MLPFTRPTPLRVRSCRGPFSPSAETGPYRLPHGIRDRLTVVLRPFRNRDAAFALATFLGRFWSTPNRLALPFPIDRRALADHAALGLTEARIRGALRILEEVGFLDRATIESANRRYQPKQMGELHRCPILFTFGAEFRPTFLQANVRAQRAQERAQRLKRHTPPIAVTSPSTPFQRTSFTISPKDKASEAKKVIMGEIAGKPESPPLVGVRSEGLEEAIARLRLQVVGR